jgi:outer membrane protein, heavy metal efflux system
MPRIPCVIAAAAIATLISLPAAAQVAAISSLTLEGAMERALAANATIVAARLRSPIGLAGLRVARERLNPEATVEIEKETPKQAFGLSFPMELGGKRARRIAVSEATVRADEAEVAATIAQVRNDVRRAYFSVLAADGRLTLMRELRDLSMRARETSQARYDEGSAPRLEVLQAELALAAARNEAIAAESAAAAARAQLNALLALPIDASTTLATAIDSGSPPAAEAAVAMARAANTELVALDRRIEEQRAKVALAQALRTPDMASAFTVTHDAEPEFTYGWRAGLAVTLPLFTSHRAGVLVEEATLTQLSAQREATLLRITGEVTAAAVRAQAQQQLFSRYRDEILPQAQQVEQLAQDAYELGQTGIAAFLQALQATRDVRLRALDSITEFQTAFADLERAIGSPLP